MSAFMGEHSLAVCPLANQESNNAPPSSLPPCPQANTPLAVWRRLMLACKPCLRPACLANTSSLHGLANIPGLQSTLVITRLQQIPFQLFFCCAGELNTSPSIFFQHIRQQVLGLAIVYLTFSFTRYRRVEGKAKSKVCRKSAIVSV